MDQTHRNQLAPSIARRNEIKGRQIALEPQVSTENPRREPPLGARGKGGVVSGSLSSTASSSGCSSVECSSLEPTANLSSGGADPILMANSPPETDKDFLEVNELLYLQRSKPINSDEGVDSLLPVEPGTSMSEFSAFTLRKSLKISRSRRAQSAAKPQVASRGPAGSIFADHHKPSCDCCCRSTMPIDNKSLGLQQHLAIGKLDEPSWRQATIEGRPSDRLNHTVLTRKRATVAPYVCLAQRQQARRSLPVPPPVVPLYKEEALMRATVGLGGAKKANPKLNPSHTEAEDVEASFQPQGSHMTPTKTSSVNILAANNNNNNNKIDHGEECSADTDAAAGCGQASNFNAKPVESEGRGMADAEGFYCEVWDDLRLPKDSTKGIDHDKGIEKFHKFNPNSESGDFVVVGASAKPNCGVFGSTLGKRTGKILERLRLGFFGNFGALPNNKLDSCELSSSSGADCEQNVPKAGVIDVSSANMARLPAGGSAIYDTPEFDGLNHQASGLSEWRPSGPRTAVRPAIPPPPPPPPPPLPPASTLALSARPKPPLIRSRGDCASSTASSERSRRHDNKSSAGDGSRFQLPGSNRNRQLTQGANSIINRTTTVDSDEPSLIDDRRENKEPIEHYLGARASLKAPNKTEEVKHQILGKRPATTRKAVKWATDNINQKQQVNDKFEHSNKLKYELERVSVSCQLELDSSVSRQLGSENSLKGSNSIKAQLETGTDTFGQKQQTGCNTPGLSASNSRLNLSGALRSDTNKNNRYSNNNKDQAKIGAGNCSGRGESNKTPTTSLSFGNTNYNCGDHHSNLEDNKGDILLKNPSCPSPKSPNLVANLRNFIMGANHSTVNSPISTHNLAGTTTTNLTTTGDPAAVSASHDKRPRAGISQIKSTNQETDHNKQKISDGIKAGNGNNQSSSSSRQEQSTIKSIDLRPTMKQTKALDLMPPPDLEQIFERRRKSIQDGDVFIYPTLYKDLNECQKCSRDNKICSCNNLYETEIGAKVSDSCKQTVTKPTTTKVKSSPQFRKLMDDGLPKKPNGNHHQLPGNKIDTIIQKPGGKLMGQAKDNNGEKIKSFYKIGVSTAPSDQKSNQLRLATPRVVIGSSQLKHPAVATRHSPAGEDMVTSKPKKNPATKVGFKLDGPLEDSDRMHKIHAEGETQHSRSSADTIGTLASGAIDSGKTQTPHKSGDSSDLTTNCSRRDDEQEPSKLLISVSNNHQDLDSEANVGAKATSISLVSPLSSLKDLDHCDLLPPLLTTAAGSTTEPLNGLNHQEMVDSNNNSNTIARTNALLSKSACDNQDDESIKSHAKIISQLIEQERVSEEQLTCNLSVGDSIKITSTSIMIGGQKFAHCSSNNSSSGDTRHTTIVPIQTSLSCRRRNLATKLSRQAICEDNAMDSNNFDELSDGQSARTKQLGLGDEDGSTRAQDSSSDALEYSPILTSVRDYIKNVNTELQVQSPSLGLGAADCEFPIVSGPLARDPIVDSMLVSGPPPVMSIAGSNMITPTTIVTSTTGALTVTSSSGTITSQGIVASGDFSGSNGGLLIGGHSQVSDHSPHSPKKSIFEGASKDEILEYLEDARERVPEILMAADDVMVINENELIVVNQLEPGLPATPISIVEAAEVISTPNLVPVVDPTQLMAASVNSSPLSSEPTSIEPEDQFRHRLQQIYHGSQMNSSQFSSGNNTMDDDTGVSSNGEVQSGLDSKVESSRNSMETPMTPTEFKLTNTIISGNLLIGSLDSKSFEDQAAGLEAGSSLSEVISEMKLESSTNCALFTIDQGQMFSKALVRDQANESIGLSTNKQQMEMIGDSPVGPLQDLVGDGRRALDYGVANRRRNSTSSEGSNRPVPSGGSSVNCTIQHAMRLQKRYSNRDSLSSPSTSPPSSASPSSSTSSNQTSGNCSAASTFYASSSLSCSSPLLALSSTANHCNTTLAFSNRPSHLCTQTQAIASRYSDQYDVQTSDLYGIRNPVSLANSPDATADLNLLSHVERDDSGLGSDFPDRNKAAVSLYGNNNLEHLVPSSSSESKFYKPQEQPTDQSILTTVGRSSGKSLGREVGATLVEEIKPDAGSGQQLIPKTSNTCHLPMPLTNETRSTYSSSMVRFNSAISTVAATTTSPTFSSSANLMSRSVHGHYATMNRLNNYFMNRHPLSESSDTTIEFQCLDCDQFIDVDQATMLHKSNELRLLREADRLDVKFPIASSTNEKLLTADQLDRAYIAAMNGLPLCGLCEKKRVERKEIILEFVETELKYGRDLKIIHDEFYRPMQIAGLLSKDQIAGVFLNLEELIMAHCKFAIRLEAAIRDAHSMGDSDFNTVNIGRLFVESAEMLHTFESYCIRQGSAACLLARLAKEKELLRIFLRVSQMENTLLRRMNLAAFLMVPVQRVTKYPLLLNRLYKVTAYHHKDREVLRDAQLKVELHLEHINQQTKGVGATNKIWRRISNLSAPISNRRGLINAEDIGYIKLRKTAMDMLKWDRDEIQFIHSGRLNFAPLNEFLIKQKMKPMRYMVTHALLIVLGKPNWKYRPDLVKSNLDSKLMTPTPGGSGVKEAALLLFREKGGRFIPCREPLFLSNCVLSADCSQYNSECPIIPTNHHNQKIVTGTITPAPQSSSASPQTGNSCTTGSNGNNRIMLASSESRDSQSDRSASTESTLPLIDAHQSVEIYNNNEKKPDMSDLRANSGHSDTLSMVSVRSLPENNVHSAISPPTHTSRSFSLASALPRTTVPAPGPGSGLTKSSSITSSNLTIINQLMTKVNSYSHKQQSTAVNGTLKTVAAEQVKAQTLMPTTITSPIEKNFGSSNLIQQQQQQSSSIDPLITTSGSNRSTTNQSNGANKGSNNSTTVAQSDMIHPQHYNHLFFNNHHHHQPYGDYEESFEIHERLSKESILLRADTPLKTRYWLQMLRYHAKDLGQWRVRRNGLANIMMMRQE